jgi:hypothetical protein
MKNRFLEWRGAARGSEFLTYLIDSWRNKIGPYT